MGFNWKEFLDDHGIEWISEGHEHCTRTFEVQTHCPLYSSKNYHLGLNPNSNNCFGHGHPHSIYELLEAYTGKDFHGIKALIKQYSYGSYLPYVNEQGRQTKNFVEPMTINLTKTHKKYLDGRGFDPTLLKAKYKIKSFTAAGKFGNRIYIPIHQDGKVVNFVARSTNWEPKYDGPSNTEVEIPKSELIYGFDDCLEDWAVIVEGVTDVWNMGNGFVGILGKSLSEKQKLKLIMRFKLLFVMLDPDAYSQAIKIVSDIKPYRSCFRIVLGDKDPGELTTREKFEVYKLIRTKAKQEGL